MILALSILVGVVIAVALFRLFFKDFGDFLECVRFYLTPNIISMFRGELAEDWWGSTKLGVWIAVSIGMGFVAHYKFEQSWGGSKAEIVTARSANQNLSDEDEAEAKPTTQRTNLAMNLVPSHAANIPASAPLNSYGVKVGDVVEISAVKPPIALRRATVSAIDTNQITVRNGVDEYQVRWKDLAKLKPSSK